MSSVPMGWEFLREGMGLREKGWEGNGLMEEKTAALSAAFWKDH